MKVKLFVKPDKEVDMKLESYKKDLENFEEDKKEDMVVIELSEGRTLRISTECLKK